jgi:hypothetical protein
MPLDLQFISFRTGLNIGFLAIRFKSWVKPREPFTIGAKDWSISLVTECSSSSKTTQAADCPYISAYIIKEDGRPPIELS